MEPALPRRLASLPSADAAGRPVRVAATARARLLGFAGLRSPPATGLLLPRTRSVHTVGMRFPLDLLWLDGDGAVIRTDHAVPPGRIKACRVARAVIEMAIS